MQRADSTTVLGDFNSARYRHAGVTTTFYRRDGIFLVNTDGPDGTLRDFEIRFTFGVHPLQQYLVELEGGRLQALNVAWDSRTRTEGGQKWFHLYPDEKIDHNDELHWTKLTQNWNHMCAECHSTNLQKNYDAASNSFKTTWSEINVSCEACHGPGSGHVAWAEADPGNREPDDNGLVLPLDGRKEVAWDRAESEPTAKRIGPTPDDREIDTCARCHARRSLLTEDYPHGGALMDTHLPSLLEDQVYHADGQILAENYEYGSFLQSRMYHAGVTCSDCHEPHSLALRAPGSGTCLQCHAASAFATPEHHHHPDGSPGADCISCHMPVTHYMVVDGRHDHSIRIPRPDLSRSIGVPNACNQCHRDRLPTWTVAAMEAWYGKDWSGAAHFGTVFHRARGNAPGSGLELAALAHATDAPDIVRATAAALLPRHPEPGLDAILPRLLTDRSAMVRRSALTLVEHLPAEHRWAVAGKLLDDPVRAVRMEAGRVLAALHDEAPSPAQTLALESAIAEYVSAQMANAEHPQSHVNLGLLHLDMGNAYKAVQAYRQAITLDPSYVIAYINLADLYRSQQDEEKVAETLLAARAQAGPSASVEHALGLHYVRLGQLPRALASLAAATRIEPDQATFAYAHAVALHSTGDTAQALKVLERVHAGHPMDGQVLMALVRLHLSGGDRDAAGNYARRIAALDPRAGTAEEILRRLSTPQ